MEIQFKVNVTGLDDGEDPALVAETLEQHAQALVEVHKAAQVTVEIERRWG